MAGSGISTAVVALGQPGVDPVTAGLEVFRGFHLDGRFAEWRYTAVVPESEVGKRMTDSAKPSPALLP